MTVSSLTSRWEFVGDAFAASFPFNNKVFATSDLKVYLSGLLKTLGTHYTVALNANQDSSPGGTVTFLTAPHTSQSVIIVREVANTQETDLPLAGPFPSEAVENELDRRTIIAQQQAGLIDRTIYFPVDEFAAPSGALASKAMRASKYLAFDANGALTYTSATNAGSGIGDMLKANNLSELPDKAAARANLQLGAMALQDPASVAITGGTIAITGGTIAGTVLFLGGGAAVDETARLSAAITAAAGNPVRVVGDLLLDGLVISVDHDLDLTGARIYYPADNYAILAEGTWGALTTVAAIAAVTSGTDLLSNVEISSTTGWAVGDWFKIWSADTYPFAEGGAQPYRAEFARVRAILSGPPRLQVGSLRETYTTTPKLRKLSTMRSRVQGGRFIANGDIADTTTFPVAARRAAIMGRGLAFPHWHDIFIESAWTYAIRLESVVGIDVSAAGQNLMNKDSIGLLGYLVLAMYGSQHGHVRVMPTSRCRHTFTTGVQTPSAAFADADFASYGGVRDFTIDGTGFSAEGASFDTHAFAYDITFIGCVASGVRVYGETSTSCFNNRGHNTTFVACRATNASVGFRDIAGTFAYGLPGETRWVSCFAEKCTLGFQVLGEAAVTTYKAVGIGCSADGCVTAGYQLQANARMIFSACMASRFGDAPIWYEGNDAIGDIVSGFTADYRQSGPSFDGTAGGGIKIGTTGTVVTGAVCNWDSLTYIGSATRPPSIFNVPNVGSAVSGRRGTFHPRNKVNQTLVVASTGTATFVESKIGLFVTDGVKAATTDASGDLTVTHGLAATPTWVGGITFDGTTFYHGQPHTLGATTFLIRVSDAAGVAVASTAVTAYWAARV